jgi:D-alanine-D-alanine ligase-like ATP-grasp enzyme
MSEYAALGYEDMELSTQILVKEALARGVAVSVLDRSNNFILLERDGKREYVKQATRTSADSYAAILIMENKEVAKYAMSGGGVRVPRGILAGNAGEALSALRGFAGEPVVVKPRSTNFGDGVALLPARRSDAETEAAVQAAFALDSAVIVEEFVPGREFRFLVIGGKTRAVLHRMPANVVGDGVSTVRALVEEKNAHPYRGEGYHSPLEKIALGGVEIECLASAGFTADSILPKGERAFLRRNSNISTGGDSIDFTDDMPESYKVIAERAAAACGAAISGVDMIIRALDEDPEAGGYAVIELNYNPALHIHDFPAEGKNRRVETRVLDLLGFRAKEGGQDGR